MSTHLELHATMIEEGKYTFPYVCYTMPSQEKHAFCEFLVDLKLPDGLFIQYFSMYRCSRRENIWDEMS